MKALACVAFGIGNKKFYCNPSIIPSLEVSAGVPEKVVAMSCEVMVRNACARDIMLRSTMLHDTLTEQNWNMFLVLFFQESTLQALVLCCATLFIFFGVSLSACALVPVLSALLLRLGVSVAHRAHADALLAELRHEEFGLVAEVHGKASTGAGLVNRVQIVHEGEEGAARGRRVVGTVSVSRHRRERGVGWVRALGVHGDWRRAGIGRALVRQARARAEALGLTALEIDVTYLQTAARALLEAEQWESRGAGERALVCGALRLHTLRLRVGVGVGAVTGEVKGVQKSYSCLLDLTAGR